MGGGILGLLRRLVGTLRGFEGRGDGAGESGGVEVRDVDVDLRDLILDGGAVVKRLVGRGHELEGLLVVGVLLAVVVALEDDLLDAEMLGLGGLVDADEDGVVLRVDVDLAHARDDALPLGVDEGGDVGEIRPDHPDAVVGEGGPEGHVSMLTDGS